MTKRKKIIIAVSVLVVVLVIVSVAVYFIFFNDKSSGMKIRAIDGSDVYQVSQFNNSSMSLNENGTFSVTITQDDDTRWFAGIGTYTRYGGKVHFTYIEAWVRVGSDFMVDNTATYIGQTHEYPISKRNQVEFVYNHITFYFK